MTGDSVSPRLNGPGWDSWWMWFGTVTGVVMVALAAVPVGIGIVCVLTRARIGHGSGAGRAIRRSVCEVALVCGTLPGVWLTMLPGGPAGPGAVSLVPLRDLATMSTFQVVGNLLLLAPLGLFTPLRFGAMATFPRVITLAAAASTAIEVLQHVLRLDRVSSVDDILLNTAGAAMAALLSRPWWPPRVPTPHARHGEPARAG